jgi:hypothetical protein
MGRYGDEYREPEDLDPSQKLWECVSTGNAVVHVVPTHVVRRHTLASSCPCRPETSPADPGFVVKHNAWDRREVLEEAVL